MENKQYYDTYYGKKVSEYGLKNGYVDYRALSEAVGDCVLCNAMEKRLWETLEHVSGELYSYYDIDNGYKEITREEAEELNMCCIEEEPIDIYQWYIISDSGAQLLMRETDELVFYDNELDVYVWGVTHWGTSWSYVLTDIKLKEKD
ncbi:hypothetical protein PND93_02780 [Faecalicoccus pleomorphus]|uniref:hypothetical protein n=1 Tax=Faecalicoccus pleomorphus TaxID=1323 RepID=UPI00233008C5|nr:hypothetical protein [Faecalicoccus pleomorphus]MDB7990510.1 hypothetical protein [Faecalicoccus pleomorphus]